MNASDNQGVRFLIEALLSPGNFISCNADRPFVQAVQDVVNDIGKIIQKEPRITDAGLRCSKCSKYKPLRLFQHSRAAFPLSGNISFDLFPLTHAELCDSRCVDRREDFASELCRFFLICA